MAKVHVLSKHARLYSLAYRLSLEGHDVTFFTEEAMRPTFLWGDEGNGPRLSFTPPEEAADLYLLDSRGLGGFGADLVRERKVVLGGSKLSMRFDADPIARQQLVTHLLPGVEGEATLPCYAFGMFNGESWLEPQGLVLYQKRLMEGERGPLLGAAGASLIPLSGRLQAEAFPPQLTAFLQQAQYRGPVHISLKLGPEALLFEDIDLNLSYPSLMLWLEIVKSGLYDTLLGTVTSIVKGVPWRKGVTSLGLHLSLTASNEVSEEGLFDSADLHHTWPDAGITSPIIHLAWVTARGVDLQEAKRRVYRTVNLLSPQPQVQYRRDLGNVFDKQLSQVKEWGWM